MLKNIEIRRIESGDLKQIYKLGSEIFSGETCGTRDFLRDVVATEGYHFGAFLNGKLIGSILAKIDEFPRIWLMFFGIKEEFRRNGLGGKLLKEVENNAKKDKYTLIYTDFAPHEHMAEGFYRKNGFIKEAEAKDWYDKNKPARLYSKTI